jgi:tetratricopeptide (TPR) repeat protein
MERRKPWPRLVLAAILLASAAGPALADPEALERARQLLRQSNPKQAYMELIKLEARLAGNLEYDYLLGVASLDSGRIDEAIIAFERVLALNPNHAGAQMDLARAYFAAGSFDLAEAGFRQLAESRPPPLAQETINRYLEAIQARRRQTTPGWAGWTELALGYDSNITGVPSDFGAAAQQSFAIIGIEPTGNSVKRDAGFGNASAGLEYSHPLSRGWSVFAGGEARLRGYVDETLFNSAAFDGRAGAALNDGPAQWRVLAAYQYFNQEGDAPGEPKPTNDRRIASVQGEWKYMVDQRTQAGLGIQYGQVRFPTNSIEDFDQVFLMASWLRSFEGKGVPLLYAALYGSDDQAKNKLPDGQTDKSKNLAGLRTYAQYSLDPKLNVFNGIAFVYRQDKDAYARSSEVETGKDKFWEFSLGVNWQFRKSCAVRAQWVYTRNNSNIDIYDFNRNEVGSAVRCEMD